MELSSTKSHERRVTTFLLQQLGAHGVGPVQVDVNSSVEQDSISRLMDGDLWIFSVQLSQLSDRFKQFGGVADL